MGSRDSHRIDKGHFPILLLLGQRDGKGCGGEGAECAFLVKTHFFLNRKNKLKWYKPNCAEFIKEHLYVYVDP